MLTIKAIAKKFNLPERALRSWIKQGLIPVTAAGNRVYISAEWLENKLKTDGKIG